MLACGFGYGLNLAYLRPSAVLVLKSNYVDCAISNALAEVSSTKHVLPNILPIASVQLSLLQELLFSGKRIDLSRCWCSSGATGVVSFYFGYFDSRLSACGSLPVLLLLYSLALNLFGDVLEVLQSSK
ncbi:hypothetical protein [Gardnerella vaginalis]|uniref:hypothetical protein n=1 Tax=Gardnerella vaginalis TaxID=2702 RepID=UPI001D0DF887|nr:hypothetical protein [Gardnerella vaginalis]